MTDNVNHFDPGYAQRISQHAEAMLDLLRDATPGSEPFYLYGFVHRVLARFGMVAIIWSIEDVQGIRPDLNGVQAAEVLEEVRRKHDAEYGVNWTTFQCTADILFPKSASQKEIRP